MFKKIEKPAAFEIRSVISFVNARNMKQADIHHQLCEVFGEHAMSDSTVRRWVRHFNELRENVHDDPRSGRPSVVNKNFVRAMEEMIQENRRFTISSLSLHFPQISRSLLHGGIILRCRDTKTGAPPR
jgi:transposase